MAQILGIKQSALKPAVSKLPDQPFRFNDLPPELRNQIYHLIIQNLPTSTNETIEVKIGYPDVALHHQDAYKTEPGLPFSQASRRARSEYLPMYAFQCRLCFSIWRPNEVESCLKWLDTFGDIRLPLTRRIYISGAQCTFIIDLTDTKKCSLRISAEGRYPELHLGPSTLEPFIAAIARGLKRSEDEDGHLYITKTALEHVLQKAHDTFYQGSQQQQPLEQCAWKRVKLEETISCTRAKKAAQGYRRSIPDGLLGLHPGSLM